MGMGRAVGGGNINLKKCQSSFFYWSAPFLHIGMVTSHETQKRWSDKLKTVVCECVFISPLNLYRPPA